MDAEKLAADKTVDREKVFANWPFFLLSNNLLIRMKCVVEVSGAKVSFTISYSLKNHLGTKHFNERERERDVAHQIDDQTLENECNISLENFEIIIML